jgi:hypothetical protein
VTALERDNVQIKARLAALERVPPIPATAPSVPGPTAAADSGLYVLNGRYVSRTEFYAAAGVAGSAPFGGSCPSACSHPGCSAEGCQLAPGCVAAGCSSTPTIGATTAVTRATTLTYGLVPSGGYATNTAAGCAATSGGTSNCSGGSCSNASGGFFQNRGGLFAGVRDRIAERRGR